VSALGGAADDPGGGCWYFAYGSNMERATFIERRGMRPLASRRAYLDDHRLCFDLPIGPGERGGRQPAVEHGARTWGVDLSARRRRLRFPRSHEGVDRGLYRRIRSRSSTDDGDALPAFAYQGDGRDPRASRRRATSAAPRGARELALPAEYVAGSKPFPLAVDERARGSADRSSRELLRLRCRLRARLAHALQIA
jgi:hypothetical protein